MHWQGPRWEKGHLPHSSLGSGWPLEKSQHFRQVFSARDQGGQICCQQTGLPPRPPHVLPKAGLERHQAETTASFGSSASCWQEGIPHSTGKQWGMTPPLHKCAFSGMPQGSPLIRRDPLQSTNMLTRNPHLAPGGLPLSYPERLPNTPWRAAPVAGYGVLESPPPDCSPSKASGAGCWDAVGPESPTFLLWQVQEPPGPAAEGGGEAVQSPRSQGAAEPATGDPVRKRSLCCPRWLSEGLLPAYSRMLAE